MDKYIVVDVTVTPTNDAYSAGDVIGGLMTIAVPGSVGGGVINSIMLVDDGNEGAVLTLYLFDATPSTIADDAAFAPTAADLKKMIGAVSYGAGDYTTINSLKYAFKEDINLIFQADGASNLYGYVACTATPTYASGKTLVFRFSILTEQ